MIYNQLIQILMKRFITFLSLCFVAAMTFAATDTPSEAGQMLVDVGTFTGLVALTSMIVTQVMKVIPAIDGNRLAKIGISALAGIAVCMAVWALQASPLLDGLVWWQALLYGLAAGQSGCGFYDVIKAIAGLFRPAADNG